MPGAHLLRCATCGPLSEPLMARRRGLAGPLPAPVVAWFGGAAGRPSRSQQFTGVVAAALLVMLLGVGPWLWAEPGDGNDDSPGQVPLLPTTTGSGAATGHQRVRCRKARWCSGPRLQRWLLGVAQGRSH